MEWCRATHADEFDEALAEAASPFDTTAVTLLFVRLGFRDFDQEATFLLAYRGSGYAQDHRVGPETYVLRHETEGEVRATMDRHRLASATVMPAALSHLEHRRPRLLVELRGALARRRATFGRGYPAFESGPPHELPPNLSRSIVSWRPAHAGQRPAVRPICSIRSSAFAPRPWTPSASGIGSGWAHRRLLAGSRCLTREWPTATARGRETPWSTPTSAPASDEHTASGRA